MIVSQLKCGWSKDIMDPSNSFFACSQVLSHYRSYVQALNFICNLLLPLTHPAASIFDNYS